MVHDLGNNSFIKNNYFYDFIKNYYYYCSNSNQIYRGLRFIVFTSSTLINFNIIELTNTNSPSMYKELPFNNSEEEFYAYTNSSVTPNVFTTYSSSIYNRSADLSNYVYEDITE